MLTDHWIRAVLFVVSSHAEAQGTELGVVVDCYLEEGPVRCSDAVSSYFASTPSIDARNGPDALVLVVRSISHASTTTYTVTARRGGRDVEVSTSTPSNEDTVALSRVVALMQRVSIPFLGFDEPGRIEGETFVLRLGAGEEPEEDDATRWYLRPKISAELSSAGFTVATARATLEVNYSDDDHRLRVDGRGEYRYLDLELPDVGRIEGGFWSGRGKLVGARSLGEGFVLGAIADVRRATNQNLDVRLRGGGGVEWLSDEHLETNDEIVGARLSAFATYDRYSTENASNELERLYPTGEASAFARWHAEAIDLSAEASISAPLDAPENFRVGGFVEITLRPTDGLELGLYADFRYQGGALATPRDMNALDPIATLVSGTDFGDFALEAQLSVAYSFGNALLHAQDQRLR
jgi:hypothetical protein